MYWWKYWHKRFWLENHTLREYLIQEHQLKPINQQTDNSTPFTSDLAHQETRLVTQWRWTGAVIFFLCQNRLTVNAICFQPKDRPTSKPTNQSTNKAGYTVACTRLEKDPVPSNEVWDTHCLISALSFVSRRTLHTASCGNSQAGR